MHSPVFIVRGREAQTPASPLPQALVLDWPAGFAAVRAETEMVEGKGGFVDERCLPATARAVPLP